MSALVEKGVNLHVHRLHHDRGCPLRPDALMGRGKVAANQQSRNSPKLAGERICDGGSILVYYVLPAEIGRTSPAVLKTRKIDRFLGQRAFDGNRHGRDVSFGRLGCDYLRSTLAAPARCSSRCQPPCLPAD